MPDGIVTEFKTTDLYLAAFLFAKQHHFLRHSASPHGKVEFIFHQDEQLDQDQQDFLNNTASYGPQDFCRGLDNARSIIRGARDAERRER